jgi:hypothetical protein
MALSPQYSWPEPDNSSLVKNGAQDIRALGDAIDTSVWNIGYGQAGKNKFINGDFLINQRSFSTSTSSNIFPADRWVVFNAGGTCTTSRQNFTPGTAPVAGYEGRTFVRAAISGQSAAGDYYQVRQLIEDVTEFAGQTVTLSFWAKANTATPSIAANFVQNFGTGGSPSAAAFATTAQKTAITTSWARYSMTFAIASISGKTLGTTENTSSLELRLYLSAGSTFNSESSSLGAQNNTFDIWGAQLEYGSKMTPFQTASGGSLQGELAMCQRYYYRIQNDSTNAYTNITGIAYSTTGFAAFVPLKTTMRVTPTAVDFASLRSFDATNTASITAITLSAASPNVAALDVTSSSLTQYRPYVILGNTVPSFIGFSAEL